ncbi:MAG TPA: dephospho-CoA kinase [Solirubrobacterales bacterium]|nr:dephospho-CoA kinase [Solirubrobacterales bacterium]
MTRFVGLTGGIGAGKSETLAVFERLGAATLSTDRVAHDLLDDDEVRAALVDRWGEEIAPAGEVDRDKVSEIVFSDRGELAWLESVTHPRVGLHVLEWRQNLDPDVPLAVVEVPLLFESAMEDAFDETLAVVAADHLRDARLRERGQGGLAGREARQLDQAEKVRRADHVIRNDASLQELESEVGRLIEQLTAKEPG